MISDTYLNIIKSDFLSLLSCWEYTYCFRYYYALKLKDSIYVATFNVALHNPIDNSYDYRKLCNDTMIYIIYMTGTRYEL